jgi:hypothetical protein
MNVMNKNTLDFDNILLSLGCIVGGGIYPSPLIIDIEHPKYSNRQTIKRKEKGGWGGVGGGGS